jgi:glutaredoxin
VRTRRFLVRHAVPYAFIDVDSDADAEQQVKRWNRGLLSTPTLDIDGQIVTEPSDEELAQVLGLR